MASVIKKTDSIKRKRSYLKKKVKKKYLDVNNWMGKSRGKDIDDLKLFLVENSGKAGRTEKAMLFQIERGKETEIEHVLNETDIEFRNAIAERIMMDHLFEYPDYYFHLDDMENKLKEIWED